MISRLGRVQMTYEDIITLLGYAGGHEQIGRITTLDRTEVVGIPMSVDTHVTAHEVYLRPAGGADTAIAVSLGAIQAAELVSPRPRVERCCLKHCSAPGRRAGPGEPRPET